MNNIKTKKEIQDRIGQLKELLDKCDKYSELYVRYEYRIYELNWVLNEV